jgi:hypothetical protein
VNRNNFFSLLGVSCNVHVVCGGLEKVSGVVDLEHSILVSY